MTPEEKAAADKAALEAAGGNDFTALLADLNKAMPPALAGSSSSEEEEQSSEEEVRGNRMGKSFKVKLEGGDEVEAVDGTELLKSFAKKQGRLVKALSAAQPLIKALVDSNAALGTKIVTIEKANAELLKSHGELKTAFDTKAKEHDELKKSFDAIANKGTGRKSATVIMPSAVEGQQPKGMEPKDFMAKALRMQSEGKGGITGQDIAVAESSLNRGQEVPAHIVKKVMAEAA